MNVIFPVCSGIISVTGSVTNAISLSYLIRKAKRTLSNLIFMMLNTFDLLVSLSDVAVVTFWYCKHSTLCGYNLPFKVALAVLDFSLESTAFATCLLSVTRTISLCLPFYRIEKRAVKIAGIIFFVQEVLRFLLRFYFYFIKTSQLQFYIGFDNGVMMVLLSIVILINLFSSLLSMWKLLSSRKQLKLTSGNNDKQDPRTKANQKATITILIVSIFFCFFNTIYCVAMYLQFFGPDGLASSLSPISMAFFEFSFWLAIPLNSAINPIIYFTRNRDMRKYFKGLLHKDFCQNVDTNDD